ncbi:MAG: hypothetical protein AAB250_13095 [Bdellovibrionota bacterium]
MKRIESCLYELRPFIFLLIAGAALKSSSELDRIGQASIGLLALSSLVILYWRYQYRSAAVHIKRR